MSAPRRINFSLLVGQTGASEQGIPEEQDTAQLDLFKSLLLERFGVDMSSGLFSMKSEQAALMQVYYTQALQQASTPPTNEEDAALRKAAHERTADFMKQIKTVLDSQNIGTHAPSGQHGK